MLRNIFVFVALSIASWMSVFGQNDAEPGLEKMVGKIPDGYNFWLYTPEDTGGAKMAEEDILFARFLDEEFRDELQGEYESKPLVIFLHGRSLCGNDLNKVRRYGTISAIEKGCPIDAYVIAPQNPGGSWKPEKIMDIVDYMCDNYNIDENRIYALGMSLGGYGTIDLAATFPDRIAAAIGMCGGASRKDLSGLADMPLWIIHGTGDSAVPVTESDKVAAAIEAAKFDGDIDRLQYDRLPGYNHSILAKVFYRADVYDWLFSHSLDQKGRPISPTLEINDEFFRNAYKGLDHSKGYRSKSK